MGGRANARCRFGKELAINADGKLFRLDHGNESI
jgi:hypothetical protein